jgi:hypothetical protein
MESKRNVLILKGDLSAGYLDLLESLLEEVGVQNKQKQAPHPWEVFSLILASGGVRYVTSTGHNNLAAIAHPT